jgi:hypothetical protein
VLPRALAAVVLTGLALSCAPDPFGVRCDQSPSCIKREEKRKRAAEKERQAVCKAEGLGWVREQDRVQQRFTVDLGCEPARHKCMGQWGCPDGTWCAADPGTGVESLYCVGNGSDWDGYCVRCADAALFETHRAQAEAL